MKGALPLHRKGENMNIHKEKCKRLKAIRKKLADGLGIDLKQRECTFEGECRGTCPKCRQEEEALNRALLGKAAAVAVSAGILLTGCQGEMKGGKEEEVLGLMTPPSEEFELDGNIMISPPEEFELEGATEVLPGEMPIDYEIEGDIDLGYDGSVPVYENEE